MNTDKIYAESIAKDYASKDNSKIVALKKLDAKAKLPATIFTYTFGILSSLVAGLGMCLAMQVIGGGVVMMVVGIIIGLIGFIGWGINALVLEWLKDGCRKSIEEVSHIIRECIFGRNDLLLSPTEYDL